MASYSYAKTTNVRPDRTKAEIEALLRRYGADQIISGWDARQAMIGFSREGKLVRIHMKMPDRGAEMFTRKKTGYGKTCDRSKSEGDSLYEQEIKRMWRALLLVIKAKLEAIESGIATFEQEFLAHLVTPDGTTVGEWMQPQLDKMYKGRMPKLLPSAGGTSG